MPCSQEQNSLLLFCSHLSFSLPLPTIIKCDSKWKCQNGYFQAIPLFVLFGYANVCEVTAYLWHWDTKSITQTMKYSA